MAPGAAEVVRRVSDSMHHALDAMHLAPHHHAPPPPPPACELAAAVLKKVKAELGPSFGPVEAAFCDEPCLQRYLRARGMDVSRASAMLKATLEWRREMDVSHLRPADYTSFIEEGWMYLAGHDETGNALMMCRKRKTRLEEDRVDNFIGFLTLLLESAVRSLRAPAERWTWVFDMACYDSRNSPRFDVTLRVLQLVSSHYPERLAKVFIVDAPTLFWVLFKAVSPFLDPVTKAKIDFVYSKDLPKDGAGAAAAARAAAAAKASGGGAAGAGAAVALADTPAARFAPFVAAYRTPFSAADASARIAAAGWAQ